jgi:hypothetical protein
MLRMVVYASFSTLTLTSSQKDAHATILNVGARALSTATQKHRSSVTHRHTEAPFFAGC